MEVPVCPVSEHAGSAVVRAGWYGREGQRRQRWLCRPKAGPAHRFAETLPRIVDPRSAHACAECATTLEPWEGQPAPRLYGFTARDVAFALAQVAAGQTYRSTAAAVRRVAGRPLETRARRTESGRRLPPPNAHGQIVSDWVEVFAPVIWAAYAPPTWPERLLLDECGFRFSKPGRVTRRARVPCPRRGRLPLSGAAVRGGCGGGPDGRLRPLEAALVVVTRPTAAGGDRRRSGRRAAATVWPQAHSHRCEWHLARNLTASSADPACGKIAPTRSTRCSPTPNAASPAGRPSPPRSTGAAPRPAATRTRSTRSTDSTRSSGPRPPTRTGWPRSTGPLEQFFRELDRTLSDRAARLTNKTRTDALLKLLAAHHNHWGSERDWADLVREHLTRHAGHARHQRQHTDPKHSPSLRASRVPIDEIPF